MKPSNNPSLPNKEKLPLGAYLLVVGIFTLAKYVSQDVNLRKQFYKSAASQLALLKSIGVSEMEKEYESRVRFLKGRFEPQEWRNTKDFFDYVKTN